jgi:putative membrane protein insertion efficiency factor
MFSYLKSLGRLSPRVLKSVDNRVRDVFTALISVYRWTLSPLFGRCCRFEPTCSQYALDAVRRYSSGRALLMISKRLGKCHPFHEGGYDPA